MKRSGLRRSSPEQIRAWRSRSKRMSRRSKAVRSYRRSSEALSRVQVRAAVFERDGYRCQLAGLVGANQCFGSLTPHHRLKASQGGAYTEANLVAACAYHNGLLESDPDFAKAGEAAGMVVRSWQPEAETLKERC